MREKLTAKQNLWQVVKFTLFSISAGIIQIIAETICLELFHWAPWVSYTIALVLSVLWNFTFNRKYTFQSTANVPIAMLKVFAFYVVFAPLSIWWTYALTDLCGWNEYVVLAGTMIINFVTEYLYTRFFVYRNSINTNERAKKQKVQ